MKKNIQYVSVWILALGLALIILGLFDVGFGCHFIPGAGVSCSSMFYGVIIFFIGLATFLITVVLDKNDK